MRMKINNYRKEMIEMESLPCASAEKIGTVGTGLNEREIS